MKLDNSILVEIAFDTAQANGSEVKFSENQKVSSNDFQNRYLVYGIMVYDSTVVSISPRGRTVIANNKGLAFTIMEGQTEKHYLLPCDQFNTFKNGGFFYPLKDISLNYPMCSLRILDNTAIVVGQSFLFALIYKKRPGVK